MWTTSFDVDMIGGDKELAIWCETEDNAKLLLEILSEYGCTWAGRAPAHSKTNWGTYKQETVYFVDKYKRLTYCNRDFVGMNWDRKYDTCHFANISVATVEVEDLL